MPPRLLALSDLHVAYPENRKLVDGLHPDNDEDWLLRGEERYLFLVELCRSLGILTPEDPYPVWRGPGGPVTIAPLFLLYDYTFLPDGATNKEQGLALAYETGVVCRARVEPTRVLRYPQFAQWCGTTATRDWHVRYNAAVVYGHLHIPRVTWHDGVRFEEVSIGYPREWQRRARRPGVPRQILPVPE